MHRYRETASLLFLGWVREGRGDIPSLAQRCRRILRFHDAALQGRHPFRPQNGEVIQGFPPVMNRHRPLLGRLPQLSGYEEKTLSE